MSLPDIYLTYVSAIACVINSLSFLLSAQQIAYLAFPSLIGELRNAKDSQSGSDVFNWSQPVFYNVVFTIAFLVPSAWWLSVVPVPGQGDVVVASVAIESSIIVILVVAAIYKILHSSPHSSPHSSSLPVPSSRRVEPNETRTENQAPFVLRPSNAKGGKRSRVVAVFSKIHASAVKYVEERNVNGRNDSEVAKHFFRQFIQYDFR